MTAASALDRSTERRLAAGLYNEVWRLMELPGRTREQDDEMLHAAHASRHHWGRVGEPVNLARGEWLCARVYAVLDRSEPALRHARRCLEILTESGGGEDWDQAAAYEAMARAHLVAGDRAVARDWVRKAREALRAIADPADRQPVAADIDAIEQALDPAQGPGGV